ncbi:ribonuclease HIII [Lactococcus allomyrinae]|uniref:Ribonuclease HIII n=1 Tax=Lactococcus allomyrinae TaxID=2419773 RepID=A0A387BFJ9_9LACT|nr:ribonuclease HIII [Lactococcus allomyrinae]AYG01378.1 ribonuclease HIII [Lactococcus allomyrinae]
MNIVLKLNKKELEQLYIKFNQYKTSSKNPYITFFAKVKKTSISVYTSGKVVFQGAEAEKLASVFGYSMQEVPENQTNIIGTDEVGNGSYFGGLFVVASYVNSENLAFLKKLGVADSKKLTDEKIIEIAPILMDKVLHIPLVVEPSKYNEVIESGYNAVSIKVALHNQAIFLLEQKLKKSPAAIIIDAFTTEANYKKYVKSEKNQVLTKVTLLTKAEDQFLAVAVSSIIARFLFLENLRTLSISSGFKLPSGAGANSDKIAAEIIKAKGIDSLRDLAKLHFANTKKALKISKI